MVFNYVVYIIKSTRRLDKYFPLRSQRKQESDDMTLHFLHVNKIHQPKRQLTSDGFHPKEES